MSDLWESAGADHALEARQASLARAEAALQPVLGFLLLARSEGEYLHRRALVSGRIEAIAGQAHLAPKEVLELADRRYLLVQEAVRHQALPEGVNPLDEITRASESNSYGSGPEKPDEHSTGVDYSHGYSEVPPGAPGGPPPQVVTPQFPQPSAGEGSGDQTTAARRQPGTPATCPCGSRLTKKGKCKACHSAPGSCTCASRTASMRRQADDDPHSWPAGPPDAGTGDGSVDTGVSADSPSLPEGDDNRTAALIRAQGQGTLADMPSGMGAPGSAMPGAGGQGTTGPGAILPAGMSPGTTSPDGLSGGMMPAPSMLPAPSSGTNTAQFTSARRDPVAEQITAVAASVRASNPHLPEAECRRVARRTVAQYLAPRRADLASSVVSDDPGGGGSGGGQQGGGGTGMMGHMLEGQGLRSMIPGGGGSAGASELAEGAELAAL